MSDNRTNQTLAMATFDSTEHAEQAVEALHDAGFTTDQMRYSREFSRESFLTSIRDLLMLPNERQDGDESAVLTMLQNMGISPDEINYYTDAFTEKGFVVVVRPDGQTQKAEGILCDNHGSGYKGN